MRRTTLFLAPLLALSAAIPFAQERVNKKKTPEFKDVHTAIAAAYEAGNYGLAMSKTRELLTVLTPKWQEAILAALPAAPQGYTILPQEKQDAQATAALAAFSASVGTVVEQKYKGDGGIVSVQVTADSPMLQMFSMVLDNPAMLSEGQELVKYGEHKALLKQEGSRWTLQIVIDSSMVEVKGNVSDEFLLRMFDQKAVDKLAAVLSA